MNALKEEAVAAARLARAANMANAQNALKLSANAKAACKQAGISPEEAFLALVEADRANYRAYLNLISGGAL